MQTGSATNLIISSTKSAEPTVGMGATKLGWTDRHPYTVVEVKSAKRVVVQEDDSRRADKNGMSECQTWIYIPNPKAEKIELTLRSDGRWRAKGSRKGDAVFVLGYRERYYDYSF